ncbi:Uncharacterised protein [Mycobacteroides abscessus subsp. abscessus]|nr:Uncharacterised protein [Mycobacteroides abscessus subsp. abscessus]SKV96770.1 Uncharacterised protein [Mycobacteroides abscessus subsp. abscessus]SKW36642.1 Uncharacterised protein [Mycobacteroides abscessus subsp. abscessus]
MNAAGHQSGAAMFNGPFFHDEMTALAGFEQSYADRLTAMGRKAPKLLTVEVPVEDTLRWLGIDPDAIGDLIERVTAQFADETYSQRSPHVAITSSPGDWKAFRYRSELTAYAVAGCTVSSDGFGGVTVSRPEGMSVDEFRELKLRVTTW